MLRGRRTVAAISAVAALAGGCSTNSGSRRVADERKNYGEDYAGSSRRPIADLEKGELTQHGRDVVRGLLKKVMDPKSENSNPLDPRSRDVYSKIDPGASAELAVVLHTFVQELAANPPVWLKTLVPGAIDDARVYNYRRAVAFGTVLIAASIDTSIKELNTGEHRIPDDEVDLMMAEAGGNRVNSVRTQMNNPVVDPYQWISGGLSAACGKLPKFDAKTRARDTCAARSDATFG